MNLTLSPTLSINTALAQIIRNGSGEIEIPSGTWLANQTLNIPNVRIRIIGRAGAVLKFTGTGPAIIINQSQRLVPRLSGFTLQGNDKATNGIQTYGMQGGVLEQLEINGFPGIGIYPMESYENSIRDCFVSNCGVGYMGLNDNVTTLYGGHFVLNGTGAINPGRCIGTCFESNYGNGVVFNNPYIRASLHDCYLENNGAKDDQEYANIWGGPSTYLVLSGTTELHSGTPRTNRMTHLGGAFGQLQAEGVFNIALFTNPANVPWEFGSLLPGSNVYSLSPTFRTGKGDWNGFEGIVFGGPYSGKV